ncbi:MAG: urea ABC transporter permease subunit UrtB, partial [Pontibacterium sp.]
MRHFFVALICLLGLLIQPAIAQTSIDESVPALLDELAKAKLKSAQSVLEKLEVTGDERLIPIFNTMLDGKLFYVKKTYQVIGVRGKGDAATYTDMLSGDQLAPFTKKQIKKIRVNNKLRVYLRGAIARIQLTDPDAGKREAAVLSLLAKLNKETIATLQQLYPSEEEASVREAMDIALATYAVQKGKTAQERLSAIATLDGSLYPEVRNALTKVAENDADASVKAAAQKALDSIAQRVEMFGFVDQLFFGLSLGSVLLLAAIGLAITFGVMGVINMAHGE